jgi:DNA invertase Pin-like site-specific DNA recombinase
VLAVQHSDRLARGDGVAAAHLVEYALWAGKAGVRIASVQDPESFNTGDFGMVMTAIAGARGHIDSKRKSAAVKSGLRRSAERGDWHGGPVPDGYKAGPPIESGPRGLVIDETRAPIIRRMFALGLEGLSYSAIARQLNAEGHTTRPWPGGKHPHNGLPWASESVGDKLSNPVYTAVLALNRKYPDEQHIPGNWDPIIDTADFDRLGAKATMRSRKPTGRPTNRYLLSGLARCDVCGRPMYSRKSNYPRKDGTYRKTYICVNRYGKGGTCRAAPVDADRIDAFIRDRIGDFFIDFEKWAEEQAEVNRREHDIADESLVARRKELASWNKKRDAARERYIEQATDAREDVLEHCIGAVKAAEEAVAQAEARLAATPAEAPTDAMLDAYNALRKVLLTDNAPLNERLKRLYAEFRIRTEPDERCYLVLPVLRPDVIETHADPSGAIKVIDADGSRLMALPGDADTTASPLFLIVPPAKMLEVVEKGDMAWL